MCCQTPLTRILSLLLTLGLFVSLGGCSSWLTDDFRDPEVRLLKVDVVKAKLLEQKFVLRFRIDNPNDISPYLFTSCFITVSFRDLLPISPYSLTYSS